MRALAAILSAGLLVTALPAAQSPAPPTPGVYFVAYRTQAHIKYSTPDVFHKFADDLIAYLKSQNVIIIEDPERGILQTDESFSTESLLNLTKNAGATFLVLATIDRPASKWIKVTVQAYDLTGALLWSEEASSGGGLTGGGAPGKVMKSLSKKLDPHIGGPGLPKRAAAAPAEKPATPPEKPPVEQRKAWSTVE
jgi:hypothetical protein